MSAEEIWWPPRVAEMLGRRGRASEVRAGNAISFEDLRNSPTALIGYSSTQWKDVTQDSATNADRYLSPVAQGSNSLDSRSQSVVLGIKKKGKARERKRHRLRPYQSLQMLQQGAGIRD